MARRRVKKLGRKKGRAVGRGHGIRTANPQGLVSAGTGRHTKRAGY